MTHWTDRMAALLALAERPGTQLRRAQRRQLRKLLGRRYAREWRTFGHWNRAKGLPPDQLNAQILENTRKHGHVANFRTMMARRKK